MRTHWALPVPALAAVALMLSATAPAASLRFFGNGTGDIDRVKIRIDDPSTSSEPLRPADIGDTDFTIEFWIKGSAADNGGSVSCNTAGYTWITGNVVIDRDRFSQPRAYGISLGGGRVAFGVVNESNNTYTICSSSSVLDGSWHHVAVQRALSGAMSVYIDGVRETQASGPSGPISYPDDGNPGNQCNGGSCDFSDPFLVFGAEKHDAGGSLSFSGWLDEIRLSNSLRYGGNFTRPQTSFSPDAQTAALYHLDENTGTSVSDADSANGTSPGALSVGGNPAGPQWSSDSPFSSTPSPGTVQFEQASYSVPEGAGSIVVNVTRAGGSSGAASVSYQTGGGTATAGNDYGAAADAVMWNDGAQNPQPITITIVDDDQVEGSETLNVTLSSPTTATLGSPGTAVITITDNDSAPNPQTGTVQFAVTAQSVNESASSVALTVSRTGGTDGTASVGYSTSNGSATGGSDFTASTGELSWEAGDGSNRTISIPILNDTADESAETFAVVLANAAGATLGTQTSATVTINDDDDGGGSGGGGSNPPSDSGSGSGRWGLEWLLALAGLLLYRVIGAAPPSWRGDNGNHGKNRLFRVV